MIREIIRQIVRRAIEEAQKNNELPSFDIPEIEIVIPPKEIQFDFHYATNIPFKIAKLTGINLDKILGIFKKYIMLVIRTPLITLAETYQGDILKPVESKEGFLNFLVLDDIFLGELKNILEEGADYGQLNIGDNEKVQVEFISANPTGPLTLGNARGGFLGDVLANVLTKAGFDVQREFYINDAGEQVIKLGHSILGDSDAVYRGKYIDEMRKRISVENKSVKEIGQEAANLIVEEMIKPVIAQKMNIKFDNWFSESGLHKENKIKKVIDIFKQKHLVYRKDGALWFKSSQFGDEKDRVLVKADGEKTYLASDIAYLKNKLERGFEQLIYIWGADHHGYIGRIKAAAQALAQSPEKIKIIIIQLVRLIEAGKEVRMSKRTGTFVTLEELIDQAGLDAARFFMLMRSADSHLNFDLSLAKEQSEKNPVYYVQYAYARINSILAKVKSQKSKVKSSNQNLKLLIHLSELALVKQLIRLPEIVEDTVGDYQVQRLPEYALDLVRAFHRFYEDCRVIDEKNLDLSGARLALVEATRIVLKNTLDLMGISAPEKM